MRVFVSEFLTTPFLNENLKTHNIPFILLEEICNKAKISEKEIDLVYFFGIKEKDIKNIFWKNSIPFFSFENTISSVVSNFLSAYEILKSNKRNTILLLSLNTKKRNNPFLKEKNKYLIRAKRAGVSKAVLDEMLIKSYFNYEQFLSKEVFNEIIQPVYIKNENFKLFLKDFFFLKNLTRENLNLSPLISDKPWEIFSHYHFAKSATGGAAIILANEEGIEEKNLKNLAEICSFNFLDNKKNNFPVNLLDAFSQTKEIYYKTIFSSVPCIIDEVMVRGILSDFNLQKEILNYAITLEEINPFGSDLFWGWAEGTNFIRRLGLLKQYLLFRKGKGILLENIPYGLNLFMEILT